MAAEKESAYHTTPLLKFLNDGHSNHPNLNHINRTGTQSFFLYFSSALDQAYIYLIVSYTTMTVLCYIQSIYAVHRLQAVVSKIRGHWAAYIARIIFNLSLAIINYKQSFTLLLISTAFDRFLFLLFTCALYIHYTCAYVTHLTL